MKVSSSSARPLLVVLLLMSAAGCKTWEPVTLSPERLIAEQQPRSVRITDANGTLMTLRNPRIVNDSIVAATAPTPGVQFPLPRQGTLSAEINSLEVPRFSRRKTILLAVAITGVAIGWSRAVSASAGGRPEPIPPDPKTFELSVLDGLRLVLGVLR